MCELLCLHLHHLDQMVGFSFLLVKFFLLNCQPGSPLRARGSKLRSRDAGEGRDREAAGGRTSSWIIPFVVKNIFKASALWADAFYKSKCPSVCLYVCVSVHL